MKEMMDALTDGLPRLGLTLTDAQKEKLCEFGAAVIQQNQVMNLTAITDPTQVGKLHLLDSLTVLTAGDLAGKQLIDVGCGAGFPGVPLAIACPTLEVTLLDSLGKRVHWLEQILPALGIPAEVAGGAAAEIDGVYLIPRSQAPRLPDMGADGIQIAVHQIIVLAGQGIEITILALALAERNMHINTKGRFLCSSGKDRHNSFFPFVYMSPSRLPKRGRSAMLTAGPA